MADILIMTPGIHFTSTYVKSLVKTVKYFSSVGITWELLNANSANLFAAREMTLEKVLTRQEEDYPIFKVDYKKIIWIDSDMAWEPQDVMKLYNSDKDIITGVYYLGKDQPAIYQEKWYPMSKEELYKSSQLEISGCGFGFIAIKKGVIESIPRPVFYNKKEQALGEDLAFCDKVSDLGYKIWVDTTVNLGHSKNLVLYKDGFYRE